MPRKLSIPSYRLHKPSGQARVIIDGKHVYLGRYGSESQEAYAKVLASRVGNPTAELPPSPLGDKYPDISVSELLVRYLDYARDYYDQEGKASKEYVAMKDAI